MSCCNLTPCTCGTCERFTKLDAASMRHTLARKLVPVVDRIRDIHTQFGLRPYIVRLMRTRWVGGERGEAEEYVVHTLDILPTPKVSDLSSLTEIVQPVGLDEVGDIMFTEISGRYTEEQLRGVDPDGTPLSEDESIFYEIEFPRLDGLPGERRRFFLRSTPSYFPGRMQWQLRLERAHEGRARSGDLR